MLSLRRHLHRCRPRRNPKQPGIDRSPGSNNLARDRSAVTPQGPARSYLVIESPADFAALDAFFALCFAAFFV